MKCQSTSVCDLGICVHIGSKNIGESAVSIKACKSLFIYEGKCAGGTNIKNSSLKCSKLNGKCNYVILGREDVDYSVDCSCGYTENNEKYCNPGTFDVSISDVLLY